MAEVIAVNMPDAHLSWGTWADYPNLNRDSFVGFKQGVELCLEHNCPLVLPGDVINKSVQDDGVVVDFLSEQLARLTARRLPTYFVVGQHEKTRRVPWLSSFRSPYVVHVNRETFHLGNGVRCYGLDFHPAGQLAEALASVPPGNEVLVCHQVWQEFMGEATNPEGTLADVPAARVVLTGDFHGHKTFQMVNKSGQTMLVVSTGSTHMRSLSEDPNKFLHLLLDDFTVRSVPILTRPVHRFSVFADGQFEKLVADDLRKIGPDPTRPAEISKPIVHLMYQVGIPDVRSRALKALGEGGFLFDRPIGDKSSGGEDGEDDRIMEVIDQGLEGCLQLEAVPGTRVYEDCLRLLRTEPSSLAWEVAKLSQEWMERPEEVSL